MRTNRSSPSATVVPVLAYKDVVAATNWLRDVFGFKVRLRIGDHRAQLALNGGAVIVTDTGGGDAPSCQRVHVRVTNAEEVYERARNAGAKVLAAIADHPYGERQFTVEDPGGNRWTFSESIADVDPKSWGATDVDLS